MDDGARAKAARIRTEMPSHGLLICAECGCASDERGRGWTAFMGEDPDGREPTSVVILCPVCSAIEFGFRPQAADNYT